MQVKSGESQSFDVAAGGTEKRAGVTFTCASAYPCTITVSNSLGTIVATWASQTLGDGTASAMASGLEPPVDTFARLNSAGGPMSLTLLRIQFAAVVTAGTTPRVHTAIRTRRLVGWAWKTLARLMTPWSPSRATSIPTPRRPYSCACEYPESHHRHLCTAAKGGSTVAAGTMNDELTGECGFGRSHWLVAQSVVQGLGRYCRHGRRRIRDRRFGLFEHRSSHHGTVQYQPEWHVREPMGCRLVDFKMDAAEAATNWDKWVTIETAQPGWKCRWDHQDHGRR